MQLERQLRDLGLECGSMVMVHASMRAVGGRAEALVSALLNGLGPEGTLMAYLDFELTEQTPYFDLQRSPAAADHGVMAEVIRCWPGAVRSASPGASVAAVGARAEWLCADHSLQYGYGPGSPFAKLVEARGQVLLLGSHLDHVTLLHYAEHLAQLPNKRVVRYQVPTPNGALDIEEFDTSEGVVEAMPHDYFDRTIRDFIATGAAQCGRVGGAPSYLLPAAELTAFAVRKMERELAPASLSFKGARP
ncbi:MAG TPA: AAC(3) family N-acetyltransferase [Polyangiaceae bacterium]|nr:AAC(3) family N-acetyltransferase [Polyangiaceae bacterium]